MTISSGVAAGDGIGIDPNGGGPPRRIRPRGRPRRGLIPHRRQDETITMTAHTQVRAGKGMGLDPNGG